MLHHNPSEHEKKNYVKIYLLFCPMLPLSERALIFEGPHASAACPDNTVLRVPGLWRASQIILTDETRITLGEKKKKPHCYSVRYKSHMD